jgi:hypothetical protein
MVTPLIVTVLPPAVDLDEIAGIHALRGSPLRRCCAGRARNGDCQGQRHRDSGKSFFDQHESSTVGPAPNRSDFCRVGKKKKLRAAR